MLTPSQLKNALLGHARARSTLVFHSANPLLLDPTRTTLLRNQFHAELRRRLQLLRSHVLRFLVELDALGLKEKKTSPVLHATFPASRQYEFATDARKLEAFSQWLQTQIDEDLLKPLPAFGAQWTAPSGSIAEGPWTVKYIESAYKRGMLNAFIAARKDLSTTQEQFLREAFGQPETLAKVRFLATRAYENLKGISSAQAAQLNRILAQGLLDGKSVAKIAREITESIDGMTRNRAKLIAQTEIIAAHAEGQLDSFEALGVEDLSVKAEWVTVGDDRVCPICRSYEGKQYTLSEARGLIPAHPRCRCSWVPVLKDKQK